MNIRFGSRLFLAATVLGAVAVFAIALLVALGVRSVVAGPDAAPSAAAPTPVGHEWSQVEGHGTDTGLWWLGTSGSDALELRAGGSRALRLEPNATSPNVIGGYSGNNVTSGVLGATIGGGGLSGFINQVTANYGTVGGGDGNSASDDAATVGGGYHNTASGDQSTVGGGYGNSASVERATVGGGDENTASGWYSTVGGGIENQASRGSATVGGGVQNTASGGDATVGGGYHNTASGSYATVPGGSLNTAAGDFSFAAGRRAKANHQGAFVWADSTDADFASTTADQFLVRASGGVSLNVTSGGLRLEPNATCPNVIGGYSDNSVTSGVYGATISGGGGSGQTNRVTDDYGTVAGGYSNVAGDNGGGTSDRRYATVGGGAGNTASGEYATVGGGGGNTASGYLTTVGGGHMNTASEPWATVGGGKTNAASGWLGTVGGGQENTASGSYATVGGGRTNSASADYATIAGGGRSNPADPATGNRVTDDYGTVSGGGNNQAGNGTASTTDAAYATVGGGQSNSASGGSSTVGGGEGNSATNLRDTVGGGGGNIASGGNATVSGGGTNRASGGSATVGGGYVNIASGLTATVPGGDHNTAAGACSFAAGQWAKANHDGSFVWSDYNPNFIFASTANNQFSARATGGVRFVSAIDGSGDPTAGVTLAAGGSSWSSISDRNLKDNFTPVDGQEVLASLAEIPITTWNLKSQDPSIRHMGPVAQDFYAAFDLGEDERYIGTLDADGVALAAIQGLYALSQEQAAQIAAQQERIKALEQAEAEDGSAGPLSSGVTAGWLILGGLVVAGLALVRAGGRYARRRWNR